MMDSSEIVRLIEAKKKGVARATRELHQTERALQCEEALMTLRVCEEMENGKPRYSNDLIRKAEITRRLFDHTVWQDLLEQRDMLEEEIAYLDAEIGAYTIEVTNGQKQQS
jgi:hypothetical protein